MCQSKMTIDIKWFVDGCINFNLIRQGVIEEGDVLESEGQVKELSVNFKIS